MKEFSSFISAIKTMVENCIETEGQNNGQRLGRSEFFILFIGKYYEIMNISSKFSIINSKIDQKNFQIANKLLIPYF
jgi:hypothetical protein